MKALLRGLYDARVTPKTTGDPKLFRGDSAFWNTKLMARLQRAGWQYSISVRRQPSIRDAIAAIAEGVWQPLVDYPKGGEAQIAETTVAGKRLVVRRTRLIGAQAELFPDWRHFAFLTNRTEPIGLVEAEHRQHAVVELTIRDLKDQALAHFPSGHYSANSAWTVIASLTHNLLRWTSLIGLPGRTIRAARTLRRRLLTLPGRLTRNARQGRCTCQPAGPGNTTSSTRSPASERSPPRPERPGRHDDQPAAPHRRSARRHARTLPDPSPTRPPSPSADADSLQTLAPSTQPRLELTISHNRRSRGGSRLSRRWCRWRSRPTSAAS